jgi:hypothetical protein
MIIEFPDASKRPKAPAALNTSNPGKEEPNADSVYPWPWLVLDGLPFVGPAPPPRPNGRARLKRNCWNDKSTESGINDFARGRRYARMMLAAMKANSAAGGGHKLSFVVSALALESVFRSMIEDAVDRQKKDGKGSRTVITSAMYGFLSELSRDIASVPD